jgi:hypothetical protein
MYWIGGRRGWLRSGSELKISFCGRGLSLLLSKKQVSNRFVNESSYAGSGAFSVFELLLGTCEGG